jgi:membrane-bound lytic murein transglycosylase B
MKKAILVLVLWAPWPALAGQSVSGESVEDSVQDTEDAQFTAWLGDLRADALAAGISEATVEAALGDVRPIERVIELDRNQPEVRLDFWTYLDRIASEARVERGRSLLAQNRALLDEISSRYGIPPSMLVAVWGVESNFGTNQGGFPVVQALVTLAHDERRATMFRRELINALKILDEGHVSLEAMNGSWAGAMGQVQFMPSTFLDFGRDGDGDDRIDIWGSTADALESAARFMSRNWQRGFIWGRQVRLPSGFDPDLADIDRMRSLDEWQEMGVRRVDGTALPDVDIRGAIILPSEGLEPAFLVYQNYRALLLWNRSHFFAIAVGHLSDRIAGHGSLER